MVGGCNKNVLVYISKNKKKRKKERKKNGCAWGYLFKTYSSDNKLVATYKTKTKHILLKKRSF